MTLDEFFKPKEDDAATPIAPSNEPVVDQSESATEPKKVTIEEFFTPPAQVDYLARMGESDRRSYSLFNQSWEAANQADKLKAQMAQASPVERNVMLDQYSALRDQSFNAQLEWMKSQKEFERARDEYNASILSRAEEKTPEEPTSPKEFTINRFDLPEEFRRGAFAKDAAVEKLQDQPYFNKENNAIVLPVKVSPIGMVQFDVIYAPKETELVLASKAEDGVYVVSNPKYVDAVRSKLGDNFRIAGQVAKPIPTQEIEQVQSAIARTKAATQDIYKRVFDGELDPRTAEVELQRISQEAGKQVSQVARDLQIQFYEGGSQMTKAQLDETYKSLGLPTNAIPDFATFYERTKGDDVFDTDTPFGKYQEAERQMQALEQYRDTYAGNSNFNPVGALREFERVGNEMGAYEAVREYVRKDRKSVV